MEQWVRVIEWAFVSVDEANFFVVIYAVTVLSCWDLKVVFDVFYVCNAPQYLVQVQGVIVWDGGEPVNRGEFDYCPEFEDEDVLVV